MGKKFRQLKARVWMLTHPYVSITPASSSGVKLSIERTKYGFILWIPGKQYKKCGKRIHVSWRH
jgi:hypothetical protein